jgi:hypothetical protein
MVCGHWFGALVDLEQNLEVGHRRCRVLAEREHRGIEGDNGFLEGVNPFVQRK